MFVLSVSTIVVFLVFFPSEYENKRCNYQCSRTNLLFGNLMRKTDKGKIYLSTESIPENGISFLDRKPYYEHIKTSIRNQQYNLYLLKGFTFTDDSASCYTLMPPLQKVDSNVINTYISDLNKAVEGLVKIFQKM